MQSCSVNHSHPRLELSSDCDVMFVGTNRARR
jgi:hypothetical protein